MSASTSVDPAHYTYRITWSAQDREFVAVCLEFPSLLWLAATPQQALIGLQHVVAQVVADMQGNGNQEHVPVPLADRPYSGRFNVRVPQTLHRRLAMEAAELGISLNRLVSERLARG
jgi:predicted HicB family RNase H-like nuclease